MFSFGVLSLSLAIEINDYFEAGNPKKQAYYKQRSTSLYKSQSGLTVGMKHTVRNPLHSNSHWRLNSLLVVVFVHRFFELIIKIGLLMFHSNLNKVIVI